MTEQNMVSFAINVAVHANAIVLSFITLPTLLEQLDIVGFLDIAREGVWILFTLLLRLNRVVLFVISSIELCHCDIGENGFFEFSGLDLGEEEVIVIV